jgi:hypothetical protein
MGGKELAIALIKDHPEDTFPEPVQAVPGEEI